MAKANNPKSNQNSSVTNQVRQIKIHTKKAEINNTETDTLEAFIGLRLNANETKKFEQVKTLLPQFKTKGNKGEDDYNKSGAMKEIMNFFLERFLRYIYIYNFQNFSAKRLFHGTH